jgi:hypothetical protein
VATVGKDTTGQHQRRRAERGHISGPHNPSTPPSPEHSPYDPPKPAQYRPSDRPTHTGTARGWHFRGPDLSPPRLRIAALQRERESASSPHRLIASSIPLRALAEVRPSLPALSRLALALVRVSQMRLSLSFLLL